MRIRDSLDVQFSQETPPLAELKRFFENVGWQSSEAFIHQAIPFKPHSLLITVWVGLKLNSKAIGMARLFLPPKSSTNAPAFIGDVIIETQYQGNGYGLHLVNAIEMYCRVKSIQQLLVEPNAKSGGFWKKIGFSQKVLFQGLLFKDISSR